MSTSMHDALIAEMNETSDLAIAASKCAIEAVRKINQLRRQIEKMAEEERAAPPVLPADASEHEFRKFQAAHFPDLIFGLDVDDNQLYKNVALHFYSESSLAIDEIARRVGTFASCIEGYIIGARKEGDPRAARGDLRREP